MERASKMLSSYLYD
ncbi:hypothetical protein [Escherichia albertii]|nr:hypothetical protein [Escherichia albertii]